MGNKLFAGLGLLFIAASISLIGCSNETAPSAIYQDYAARLAASGVTGAELLDADREMRVAVVTQLKSAIINHYANLDLKNVRIKTADGKPFDSVAHLDGCIDTETKTNDTSDLHFIDRVRMCIAAFQDTHFAASARTPMAGVSVGFLVRKIGGKYIIVAIQKELLNYVAQISDDKELDKVIAIGNEVLEVDGQSPAKLAEHYQAYIGSSSPGHRTIAAETAIFARSFDYPTKKNVQVKIKSATQTYDYELPWWASLAARNRLDTSEYFKKVGIPVSDRVKMFLDADGKVDWKTVQLNYKGYLDSNPLVPEDPFRPLVPFKSDSGAIGARLGTIVTTAQTFCYAQLLTFSSSRLTAPDGTSLSFVDTMRKFVKSCKASGLNLVMDLRSNGGGNGSYPAQILSLLTPSGAKLANKVMSFRVNTTTARLMAGLMEHPEVAARDLGDVDVRFLEELKSAADLGLPMTNAIPERSGTIADAEVGGYSGKIVVLVTPNCVSACDGMAAILKRSGRATVLGTHTNGTGAGFQGSENLDSGFIDTYDELSIKIPNYQFGYATKAFANLVSVPYASVADDYFTENRPTMADITVEATPDDVTGKKNSWLEAVVKELATPAVP